MEQKLLKFKKVDGLVSIILPTLNSEIYIKNCIESIVKQTYKNIELVVIDGFSTDKTINIIENYKNKIHIKIIKIETQNLASALNVGIINSNGEFIARIDSDDIMTKNRIKNQINYFKENKFNGVLGTQAVRFSKFSLKPFILNSNQNFLKLSIFFGSPFVHPSVMISRDIFEKGNFYDESYDECEDFAFWSNLSSSYDFKNLKSFGLFYRVHANSASNFKSNRLDVFRRKIIENNLKLIELTLNDNDIQSFLKIISLNISRSDDFDIFNKILSKVYLHMKNHNILIKTYKNDLDKFLEMKFFRFYLRLLRCKNFNFKTFNNSQIKISFWRYSILKFFSIINFSL